MNRIWISRALVLSSLASGLHACKRETDEQHGTMGGTVPPPAAEAHERRLGTGTVVTLVSTQTITSRSTRAGARITARSARTATSSTGDSVIPAGAVFAGRVTAIRAAPNPGATGTLTLAFDSVRIDGSSYPIGARVVSLATVMKGRGVTTTDAGKTAAGAVIGGVAGRVIGGNRRGTIVGAVAGGAAGAVIAHNTRDIDIVLPEGGAIRLELTRPFGRDMMAARRP